MVPFVESNSHKNFAPEKGAALQEYFVYFKKTQRIYGVKFWGSAEDNMVPCRHKI